MHSILHDKVHCDVTCKVESIYFTPGSVNEILQLGRSFPPSRCICWLQQSAENELAGDVVVGYLLKHSANIAAVNSDGDVPLDLAEDDCMETLLRAEIEKRGIDTVLAKREEEEVMLQDARQWLNGGKIEDIRHPKTGASALHVAAAKGYIEVMRLLLQANFDPNVRDKDGWTPLHAAAHWGVEEACRLLVEHFCDMNALNNVGQRPCDVTDEEIVSLLEELQKKQEDLRSEKEATLKRAIIDTGTEQPLVNTSKHRRSSVCRMSSKEKISVQDQSKERKTLGTITVGGEEDSSSSEEETELPSGLACKCALSPDTVWHFVQCVVSRRVFSGPGPWSIKWSPDLEQILRRYTHLEGDACFLYLT
ncbi:PREDICTED: protein phosphatase 1 regulatory subunit 12C-like [Nanorana parkeri]|uniref:protein phosphatase 1 regulatory subunit 12C-like n=1 Tax=Nanorana parkeri TaxID=125878 RepID=UPI00085470C1|nr:PREDICTED: protein phosphatase 1 regulatory subunit 12C-like [Nanorana parkeri]